jgi:adenine-specific DNA-methyltransferase
VLEISEDAFDHSGNLVKYHDTNPGKRYLAALKKAKATKNHEALEAAVYNHLYAFFNRYWQDGDFISKRRLSKSERYAIPYNGEEVILYWANRDQYYVKTGEHFTDYTWKAQGGVTVHFKLVAADVEQNNVKGEKRFFLPRLGKITWEEQARKLTIPFEFRPLDKREAITYGGKNQQEAIIAKAVEEIPGQECLKNAPPALHALTAEKYCSDNGKTVTNFEYHLRRYTRRNTSDFFIHKDLKGFLSRELDFYLKNEVLNLEEMEAAGEMLAEGWFQMMRLIKRVGGQIIDFLAQIEEFQKMLWEKRKFITETFYCITVGHIPEEFYPEIVDCEAQWEEWKALFHVDEIETNLFTIGKDKNGRRMEILRAYPTLVLDTRHFPADFTDRLLASFDNLDEVTDGLLVHSENWQALNLLIEKYREQVKCIYIDPPFNAKSSEIMYKNDYKHSSWLTFIENRLLLSKPFYTSDAVIVIAIDEVEQEKLGLLISNVIPEKEKTCVTVVHNPTGQQGANFSSTNEYAYFLYPQGGSFIGLQDRSDNPDIRPLRDVSKGAHLRSDAANCFYPIYVRNGKIIGFGDICNDDYHPNGANVKRENGVIEVYPIDPQGVERKWVFARQSVESIADELEARFNSKTGIWDIIRTKSRFNYKTVWTDSKYSSNSYGSRILNEMLPNNSFTFPKSIHTVRDSIDASLNNQTQGLILDFFAGSGTTGHAVINLNREDGGRRKFILVEMAQYFDTVLLPRIKKVTFSPEWKDGKPKRMATAEEAGRSPRIVKVIRMESYEDALNNITFNESSKQHALQFEDYLLQYMLQWETRESETLLNVEKLAKPFSYRLQLHGEGGETRLQAVDLPETFAYLLGLSVEKRQVYSDHGRRYLVYRGTTREGRRAAVIWRETEGWTAEDYSRDRDFVAENNLTEGADDIYVNGDSYIREAQALEKLFKERMFAPLEV